MEFSTQLQIKYQNVLRKYENHERIDNKKFRLDYPDYYPNTEFNSFIVRCQYFFQTKFIYLLLMIAPAIILIMILKTK